MKILVIVEDDADMQLLVKLTLSNDDRLSVSGCASTADEAVHSAEEMQPDLVVLDHFIDGDVMGLQAAPRIKAVAPESAVLLFTSHDLQAEAAREPSIDGFLLKRDISDLLPTVQKMLDLHPNAA